MTIVETEKLLGVALDWAVAKANGFEIIRLKNKWQLRRGGTDSGFFYPKKPASFKVSAAGYWQPSIDWSQGGPLIDSHKVVITYHNAPDGTPLASTQDRSPAFESGDTVLIAAMRAIVAAKVGGEVDVPEELTIQ